jgi:hypothetical protein
MAASPATTPSGSDVTDGAAAVLRATVEKEVVDAMATKKVMDDAVAAEWAVVDKKAADATAAKKAANVVGQWRGPLWARESLMRLW